MSISNLLPPGLLFILKSLPNTVVLPLIIIRCIFAFFDRFPFLGVPWPIQAVCYALSIPSFIASRILWKISRDKYKAARLGIAEVPQLKGNMLGNLDVVMKRNSKLKGLGYSRKPVEDPFEKLGPLYNTQFLWSDMYHTSQPEHMKIILATEFQNFIKGPTVQDAFRDVLGTGVFNSDGDMWQFHRSMVRRFFARDKAIQYSIFEKKTDRTIALLMERTASGKPTDVQDLFMRYSFDSTVEFLFNAKLETLEDTLAEPYYHKAQSESCPKHTNPDLSCSSSNRASFSHVFESAQSVIRKRLMLGSFWPLNEFWHNMTLDYMKVVDRVVWEMIERSEELSKEKGEEKEKGRKPRKGEETMSLLDVMKESTIDKTVWKDEVLNIFVAAKGTTAALITFTLYSLANHSYVFKRLRSEILDCMGGSERVPGKEDIKELKYLRAVVNESLRLYPPTPLNVREAVKDTSFPPVTPGGPSFFIPGGTRIMYHTFSMHRRKDLWGPDALVFDPDRWLDDRLQKYFLPNPFIFLPFNAGPRICPGQQFALDETCFLIIRLLQKFDSIDLALDAQPPEWRVNPELAEESFSGLSKEKVLMKANLTIFAPGGMWMKLKPASTTSTA